MITTVKNAIAAYEWDIEVLKEDKKNTNRTKLIQRDELMLQILHTLPLNLKLNGEGTPLDPHKINAGTLTEMAIAYHLNNNGEVKEVAKSGGLYDIKRGRWNVEIKLSVNGSCYNTPVREPMHLYLVNRDGVFSINKSECMNLLNKGKLPFKEWEGAKHLIGLEKALGFIK